jgi:hypothetical protein
MRTYGRLKTGTEAGEIVFYYRPWLVLPERSLAVVLPDATVGKGLFISSIQSGEMTAFVLPPRYRDHEAHLARVYGLSGGVRAAGLMKAWGAVKELFGGSAARAQVVG